MKVFTANVFLLSLVNLAIAHSPNPGLIFPSTTNESVPSHYWLELQKPFPTNAWFTNLVLDHQSSASNAVNIFPYSMKISPMGVSLSFTKPTFYAEEAHPSIVSAFYYQFENQLTLGPSTPMMHYGLDSYHGLGIKLIWKNGQQFIKAPILQGSPYLTEFFTKVVPQLSTRFKIISINQQTKSGPLVKANRYELVLALNDKASQTWVLYSETPIALHWTINPQGEFLTADEPYSGWLRLVLLNDTQQQVNNNPKMLDTYSATIPMDYQQEYKVNNDNIGYSFSWQTQNQQAPLMLSLTHQRNTAELAPLVSYPGIKGRMLGETKAQWGIILPKVPLLFLEPRLLSSEQKAELRDSLRIDANDLLQHPFPDDGPYQVGKRYARAARLILIADYLKEDTLKKQMLVFLENHLRKKMLGESTWQFQYDKTWGGIIPSIDSYGARHYNDHHFHYGYWVYTFAVIAKFDQSWLNKTLQAPHPFTPRQWIETLIRDYANSDKTDPYFPVQRHQDDYAGHSWASGLTAFADGQNEQSSSEAVNAYYAMALYASVIKDKQLLDWAQFLMMRELVAAQTYWQIPNDSAIYNEKYKANNQVVANLSDNKIDANAFFIQCQAEYRCGLEYAFGIQMLPFTAITLALLDKKWLKDINPVIQKLIAGDFGPIPKAWQWILIKGVASIMEKQERDSFLKKAIQSEPSEYDLGDSKTNTLYFLM